MGSSATPRPDPALAANVRRKPRVRWNGWMWECSLLGVTGAGLTPKMAYEAWLTKALHHHRMMQNSW